MKKSLNEGENGGSAEKSPLEMVVEEQGRIKVDVEVLTHSIVGFL